MQTYSSTPNMHVGVWQQQKSVGEKVQYTSIANTQDYMTKWGDKKRTPSKTFVEPKQFN